MATAGVLMMRLGSVSAGQWGLVTSAQARGLDVTAQQLARMSALGLLERVRHGVYRMASAPPEEHTDLQAAWLSLDPGRSVDERLQHLPGAVVCHLSAAALHRLGDLDAPRHEFRVARRHQTRDENIRLHHSRDPLGARDWTVVGGLPVTTARATIADLAAAGIDGGHLAGIVRDALTGGHVSAVEVEEALSPAAHRYGAAPGAGAELLAELLAQAGIDASSVRITDLLARRHARIAAGPYVAHPPPVLSGELQGLLAPLMDLVEQTAARHTDPAVQAISDVLVARLAPIVDGLSADLLAATRPSVDGLTDVAVAPVLETVGDHLSATIGPLRGPTGRAVSATVLSGTAAVEDHEALDRPTPGTGGDTSDVVDAADEQTAHPGRGSGSEWTDSTVTTAP